MTSPDFFPILVIVSSPVEQSLNGQVQLPSALLNVMTYRTVGTIITRTFAGNNWSEPHNVKFVCMACMSVRTSQSTQLDTHTVYCAPLLNMCAYCPASFIEQVCPTVRPHLHGTNRERIATETWDERATTLHHLCIAISCSYSPHNVLHSPGACSLLLDQMEISDTLE